MRLHLQPVGHTELARSSKAASNWDELPEGLRAAVIAKLSVADLARVCCVSKELYALSQIAPKLNPWRADLAELDAPTQGLLCKFDPARVEMRYKRIAPTAITPTGALAQWVGCCASGPQSQAALRTMLSKDVPAGNRPTDTLLASKELFDACLLDWHTSELDAGNEQAPETVSRVRQARTDGAKILNLIGLPVHALPPWIWKLVGLDGIWCHCGGLPVLWHPASLPDMSKLTIQLTAPKFSSVTPAF